MPDKKVESRKSTVDSPGPKDEDRMHDAECRRVRILQNHSNIAYLEYFC